MFKVYKKFEDSGSQKSREICNRKFGDKEKWTIKEMVSIRRLILSYTMQQVIPNICTKFQNPRCSCSWEIFWHKFLPMYYIGVRDGKMKNGKRKQKLISASWFFFPTIYLATLKVYTKFEDFGSHRSPEIYDKIFYWRERKMANNGNDKQEETDSLLHNTTRYTQHLYQISKS